MSCLTVNQAIERLQQLQQQGLGEKPLQIPFDPGHATIGGQPTVPVQSIEAGFDWDQGKVLVSTPEKLGVTDEVMRKKLRTTTDTHGRLIFQLRRILRSSDSAAEKLAQVEEALTPALRPKPASKPAPKP